MIIVADNDFTKIYKCASGTMYSKLGSRREEGKNHEDLFLRVILNLYLEAGISTSVQTECDYSAIVGFMLFIHPHNVC